MSLLSWNGSFSWCRFQCCPSNIRHEKKTIRWGIDDKYCLKHEQQCFIRYLRYEAKSSIFRSNKTSAVRRSCRSPGGFSDAGAGAEFCMPEPELHFPSSGKMTWKQYEMRQMSNDC
jgi:hypothetical protein